MHNLDLVLYEKYVQQQWVFKLDKNHILKCRISARIKNDSRLIQSEYDLLL